MGAATREAPGDEGKPSGFSLIRCTLRRVPDLSHLWQRFMLTISLVVGLAVGAAATVFGYSNLTTVNVNFSVVHIEGVPLWTVAVVPLAFVLVAGTLYHWTDSLHHFTEHMRHRRRVHELEAELASLRAHLDQVLDMPDHSMPKLPRKPVTAEPVPAVAETSTPALPQADAPSKRAPKRVTLTMAAEPSEPAAVTTNGGHETPAFEAKPET
jgi:uncharacterized membrane protein